MRNSLYIFIALLLLVVVSALGQAVAPVPVAPESLSFLDKILAFLPDGFPVWVGAIVAFLFDVMLRIWPTAKPKSVLLAISKVLKVIEKIFEKLVVLCDSILQNVKK